MKPTTYMVGYKGSPQTSTRYFGPFVSESVADFFTASLPKPLNGGWVRTVLVQPFLSHEGRQVSQLILRERREAVDA